MIAPDEARLLDRLTISAAPPGAAAAGLRRSRTRGAGLEFHEFRPYQPGDDPRSIDWTVEARLQQLVVRVSNAEGDARLHLLVDVSGSMGIGTPSKLGCARRLAAALSYVAIQRRDPTSLSLFAGRLLHRVPPGSGRSQLSRILTMLRGTTASGPSSLDRALLDYGAAVRGPGLAVVLSDFFDAGATLEGVQYLRYRGLTPAVVQIVAPEELDPRVDEATELVDVEDPHAAPVVVDATARAAYLERLQGHAASLRAFCAANRLPCARLSSDMTFPAQVAALEQAGLFAAFA